MLPLSRTSNSSATYQSLHKWGSYFLFLSTCNQFCHCATLSTTSSSIPTSLQTTMTTSSASTLSLPSEGNKLSTTTQYYNFNTIRALSNNAGVSRLRRISNNSSGIGFNEDGLPNENYWPVDENDPYKHIRIFRKDLGDVTGRNMQLSINMPIKKFVDSFCDFDAKRCKLCNETFVQWNLHSTGIPHSGREGILLELVRAHCGTPEEIIKMWWHRLHNSPHFDRIKELSHDNSHIRKRRITYLLRFLKDRKIIYDTFRVQQAATTVASAGRSWEFERLEFIGDNVVKCVFNNRLNCIFPVHEGGTRGKICNFQFVIDGNDGLARAYDYLEMETLTETDRVVSKFKSDVIECLFGELQLYLYSTTIHEGIATYNLPFSQEMYSIRALVSHTLEELAHVMFMYHLEYVLGSLQRIFREQQITPTFTEPVARTDRIGVNPLSAFINHSLVQTNISNKSNDNNKGKSTSQANPSSSLSSSSLTTTTTVNNLKFSEQASALLTTPIGANKLETNLTINSKVVKGVTTMTGNLRGAVNPIKIPHNFHGSGSALYLESTNYDSFTRVVSIERLHDTPVEESTSFTESSLSTNLSGETESIEVNHDKQILNMSSTGNNGTSNTTVELMNKLPENISTPHVKCLCDVKRDVNLERRIRNDWPKLLMNINIATTIGSINTAKNKSNLGKQSNYDEFEHNNNKCPEYIIRKDTVLQLSPIRRSKTDTKV